jgi:hypothetical protein
MKTRIELSCVEDDLHASLHEVKKLLVALESESTSLKVFHDRNRDPEKGHSYISVTKDSAPNELAEIYRLKRENAELRSKLMSTDSIKK